MTLQQLEYILALNAHRHYIKAADSCFVTQPTLSMQVQKLEEEYGILIFDRDKTPLVPTEIGKAFIERAQSILNEVKQLQQFISEETDGLNGIFNIGIIPTISSTLLPLFLPEIERSDIPSKLHIQEMQSERIMEKLHLGEIDIGILSTPLNDNNLREIPIYTEPFLLYLPENHSLLEQKTIRTSDLNTDEMLLLEEGHCFREQALRVCGTSADSIKKHVYKSGSIETMVGLCNAGFGYTLIPRLFLNQNNVNPKRCRWLKLPHPAREVSLVVHKSYPKEAFLEMMQNLIQESLPDFSGKEKESEAIPWR
jgi:LysR family hydrogen peroxide-inducible transcriptional activator